MGSFPLRLDTYFFPHQEVVANKEFDPHQGSEDTVVLPSFFHANVREGATSIEMEATVETDEAQSFNPRYTFRITAYGIIAAEREIDYDLLMQAQAFGFNVLFGAIRERLATLTARAPWGEYILGPITPESTQVSRPDSGFR